MLTTSISRYLVASVLLSLIACSVAASAVDGNSSSISTITITDSANRSVEIPYPVKSMVILNYCAPMEVCGLGAAESIIGIDMDTEKKVEKGLLQELKSCPIIGSWDSPNYEKIAALKPDVVISFSAGWPPEPNEIQEKLSPFDIKVVGLDFYRMDVWSSEIQTLGTMLGREAEAEAYIKHFQENLDLITNRTSSFSQNEKKKVYFEGVKDYFTYGGAGFGCGVPGMIKAAGGADLYPERDEQYFEVNPEDVAKRNPDIIFKLLKVGWGATNDTEFKTLREQILKRPELAKTNAVKNGQVYIISYDLVGDEGKKFGVNFLAKALYPELFKDQDPLSFYRDYFQKYQGSNLSGFFFYPTL